MIFTVEVYLNDQSLTEEYVEAPSEEEAKRISIANYITWIAPQLTAKAVKTPSVRFLPNSRF